MTIHSPIHPRGIVICFRKVLQRHGYKDITDTAIKRTIGKTLEDSFSILTGITDMEQLIALKEEYSEEENQHMNRNTRLFTDTLPTLHKLRRQGARIGIISTKNRFRIEEFMKMHLPQGWFDIIIGMEDVSRAKPDPEGLLLAIEKLKVSPGRNSVYRRQYRRRPNRRFGGVCFAGITSGMTKFGELAQYPHVSIISNLKELVSPPQKYG